MGTNISRQKYQLRMYYTDVDKNTAGSKATLDCSTILGSIGLVQIDVPIRTNRSYTLINVFQTLRTLCTLFLKINRGSVILVQYPLLGINKYVKQLAKAFRWMDCKSIVLIHDVDSLRQHGANRSLAHEISGLNGFDYVISHNSF